MGDGENMRDLMVLVDEFESELPSDWRELVAIYELLYGAASLLSKKHNIKIKDKRTPSLVDVLNQMWEKNQKAEFQTAIGNAEILLSMLEENEYFQEDYDEDESFEESARVYKELVDFLRNLASREAGG